MVSATDPATQYAIVKAHSLKGDEFVASVSVAEVDHRVSSLLDQPFVEALRTWVGHRAVGLS